MSYEFENSRYRSARKRKIVDNGGNTIQRHVLRLNSSQHPSLLGQLHFSDQNWSATSKHFTGFPESLHEFYSIPPWQTPN